MPDTTQESVTPGARRSAGSRQAVPRGTTVDRVGTAPERVRPMREPAASGHKGRGLSANISFAERATSVIGGGLLALHGLRRRRSWLARLPLFGLGAALIYRGGTGRSKVYRRLGVEHPAGPVKLVQSVTVNRSPEEVYGFWRRLENLPKFMRHIRSVEQTSATRSHWAAQAVGSTRALEWDSEILEDRPNEVIRWRSVPNGAIQHGGEVRFKRAPGNRGTEVHVYMEYQPTMGTAVAALSYPFNKQIMKEEIRRLKWVLETGEIPTTEGQPAARHQRGQRRGGAR